MGVIIMQPHHLAALYRYSIIYLVIAHLVSSPCHLVNASNILFAPFPYKSHVGQFSVIGEGLSARGHSVFIILPESYPDLEATRKVFNVLTYRVKDPDFYTMPASKVDEIMSSVISVTPLEDLRTHVEGFIQFCTNCLEDEALSAEILSNRIDYAIIDAMPNSRCYFILAHNLNIRYLSFTTQYEPWLWKAPALPSFVPFPFAAAYTDRMSFVERVGNLMALLDWTAWPGVAFLEDAFVIKYLTQPSTAMEDGKPVTYASLIARSELWLLDTDWALEFPRPVMPNEIHVGGLTTRPARPVQPGGGNIQRFVDEARTHGLILATFGSTDILTDVHMDKFMKAFSNIKQSVLLRYTSEISSELSKKIPKNVLLSDWLPQNDILGHPNTKLFLTHCGANGQFEALYNAVPMIAFPLFGDQFHNALRAESLGIGRTLNMHTFTSTELKAMIHELLGNSSYKENIVKRSAIFKDQKDTPKERAVWWIEHTIRHGGSHLHSVAQDMPWYEYLMLDIFLVMVVVPIVLSTVVVTYVALVCFRRKNGSLSTVRGKNKMS